MKLNNLRKTAVQNIWDILFFNQDFLLAQNSLLNYNLAFNLEKYLSKCKLTILEDRQTDRGMFFGGKMLCKRLRKFNVQNTFVLYFFSKPRLKIFNLFLLPSSVFDEELQRSQRKRIGKDITWRWFLLEEEL